MPILSAPLQSVNMAVGEKHKTCRNTIKEVLNITVGNEGKANRAKCLYRGNLHVHLSQKTLQIRYKEGLWKITEGWTMI